MPSRVSAVRNNRPAGTSRPLVTVLEMIPCSRCFPLVRVLTRLKRRAPRATSHLLRFVEIVSSSVQNVPFYFRTSNNSIFVEKEIIEKKLNFSQIYRIYYLQ